MLFFRRASAVAVGLVLFGGCILDRSAGLTDAPATGGTSDVGGQPATGGAGGVGGSGATGGGGGSVCGNDTVEGDELCDGTDLGGQDCTMAGYSNPDGLACTSTCDGVVSDGCAATCGDGMPEPGEECDDANQDPLDGCMDCKLVDGTCSAPYPITLTVGSGRVLMGDTVQAMDESLADCVNDMVGGPEHVFAITAGDAGFLTAWLDPSGTAFDSILYASATCGDSDRACADTFDNTNPLHGGEVVSFELADNETIYLTVDGFSAGDGAYELHLSLSAGTCADPVELPLWSGIEMCASGSTTGKTDEEGEMTCGGDMSGDVVYHLQPMVAGSLAVSLESNYDSVIAAYNICGDAMSFVACDGGGGPETLNLTTTGPGDEGFIWADGAAGAAGRYTLCIDPPGP
ncbi:MAG: DUF4215 domain-containing protein [Myxococcales bacterium]|nr:DUF4215 domain-containing protein [Myxococcales bacterium]